jgi:hypothetical protein
MPEAVMVIVGGPAGAGAAAGGAAITGVGDVGAADGESLEHETNDVSDRRIRKRSGIILDAGGATGQVEPITRRR